MIKCWYRAIAVFGEPLLYSVTVLANDTIEVARNFFLREKTINNMTLIISVRPLTTFPLRKSGSRRQPLEQILDR